MIKYPFILLTILFACLFSKPCSGTHLRGGHIEIKQQESSFNCSIKIVAYVNTKNTSELFGDAILNFGDGSTEHVGNIQSTIRLDLDPSGSIGYVIYTTNHVYSRGTYTVTYREQNRNEGIINITNSVNTAFYLESVFQISDGYESPEFLVEPFFKGTTGEIFTFSLSAKDANNFTLFYELITPKQGRDQPVNGYKLPDNISINPYNGLLVWDTQGATQGEYLFTVRIKQVKDNVLVGDVIQDFQIILKAGTIEQSLAVNKSLDNNNRIYVPEDDIYKLKIFAEDIDGSSIELKAYSELIDQTEVISMTSYDSTTEDDKYIRVGVLQLKSMASIVRDNPYAIVIRASYDEGNSFHDISFSFYTKDIELTEPPIQVGIGDEISDTQIYPNPTSGILTIESIKNERLDARITNIEGKEMLQQKSTEKLSLNLQDFTPGVYILKFMKNGKPQVPVKILKKN